MWKSFSYHTGIKRRYFRKPSDKYEWGDIYQTRMLKTFQMETSNNWKCTHGKFLCWFLVCETLRAFNFSICPKVLSTSKSLQTIDQRLWWLWIPLMMSKIQRYVPKWINRCWYTFTFLTNNITLKFTSENLECKLTI